MPRFLNIYIQVHMIVTQVYHLYVNISCLYKEDQNVLLGEEGHVPRGRLPKSESINTPWPLSSRSWYAIPEQALLCRWQQPSTWICICMSICMFVCVCVVLLCYSLCRKLLKFAIALWPTQLSTMCVYGYSIAMWVYSTLYHVCIWVYNAARAYSPASILSGAQ